MAQLPTPTTQQAAPEIQMEALRRRASLGASTTAAASNSPNPVNPLAQEGLVPQGDAGVEGTPSDGTIAGMKQQKGEAEKLTQALVWRMKKLTDRGE